MKEIRKTLHLSKDDYFEIHLSVINCLIPIDSKMTPMEIKVISAFLSLDGDVAAYRLGPSAKKIVMQKLELSPAGLSNYFKTLRAKGLIVQRGDIAEILPILIPEIDLQEYLIRLVNSGLARS